MSRKNILSCLTAILVALTLIFSSTQTAFANEESDKRNAQGEKYYNSGNYEAAINEFKAAIAIDPNNAEYHNNLGVAYGESKEYDKAISELNTAINLAPNNAFYYNNRAYVYKYKGEKNRKDVAENKKALDEYKKNHPEAFASQEFTMERFEEELKDYPGIKIDFSDEMFDKAEKNFLIAGKIYFDKKEYDKAKDAFNNATMADGMLMIYIDDNSDGILDKLNNIFDDANKKDVSDGEAYFWSGEVESRLTEKNLSTWQNAIDNYTTAIRLGFIEDFVFTARGRAKYELKDYTAAIKDFTTAVEIDATHAEAYKWRGETYCELNDFEKARDDFQQYLDYDGKNLDEETKQVYKDKIDKCEKAIRNNDPIEKFGIAKPILGLFIFFILCYCIEFAYIGMRDGNARSRIKEVLGGAFLSVITVFCLMLILAELISGAGAVFEFEIAIKFMEGVSWFIKNSIVATGALIILNEDLKIAKQDLGWSVLDGIINLTQTLSEMLVKNIVALFDMVTRRKV